MINTKLFLIIPLLSMILFSCSHHYHYSSDPMGFGSRPEYVVLDDVPIDSTALRLFAIRINQNYIDYASASGYRRVIDSIDHYCKEHKGPHIVSSSKIKELHGRDSRVVYTFDKQDSCVFISVSVGNKVQVFGLDFIPILPNGRYLVRHRDQLCIITLHNNEFVGDIINLRPPNQALKPTE